MNGTLNKAYIYICLSNYLNDIHDQIDLKDQDDNFNDLDDFNDLR